MDESLENERRELDSEDEVGVGRGELDVVDGADGYVDSSGSMIGRLLLLTDCVVVAT